MQSSSIKVLCQNLLKVASNPIVKGQAEGLSTTFTKAFELFAKCHKGYNSNVVTNSAIKQTGNLKKYLHVSDTPKPTINIHRTIHHYLPRVLPPSSQRCTSWRTM